MTTAANEDKQRIVTESMSTAVADLKALVRDAEEVLANAGEAAEEKVADLQTRMRHALETSRESLSDLQESAREHLDECDRYVRSHPYQSIGVAAAVGALLGILLGRRNS